MINTLKKIRKMRRIFGCFILFVSFLSTAFTQEGISYQVIARDNSGSPLVNLVLTFTVKLEQASILVYQETHTETSNKFGLCQMVIGQGTVQSNTWSSIDWSNSTVVVISAIGGGNTYDFGSAPFRSVPHALHAKTAESITGTVNYTETDPAFTSSEAVNIDIDDITNLDKLSGINTGDQDISGIITNDTDITGLQIDQVTQNSAIALNSLKNSEVEGANAGDMKYWNGTAWIFIPTTVDEGATLQMIGGVPTWAGGIPPIGKAMLGGVVAYIFQPGDRGYVAGEVHGLIAAKADQSTGAMWALTNSGATGAADQTIGAGQANTTAILNFYGADINAAKICDDYSITDASGVIYDDWYLPSYFELIEIYKNRVEIGGFNTTDEGSYYWSSNESLGSRPDLSYYCRFSKGAGATWFKRFVAKVRAVRSF